MLIVLKSGSLNFLEPSGLAQACNGVALHLPLQRLWLGYHARHMTGIASNHLLERVLVQVFSLYSHCAPIWGQVEKPCVTVFGYVGANTCHSVMIVPPCVSETKPGWKRN